MKPYADTNLLTRLYLVLPDSPEAHALASQAKEGQADPFPMTWLHRSEFVNALQLHVFAGRQPGQVRVTSEQSAIALEQFREDLTGGSFLRTARLSETLLEDEVEELALRFTAKHGFRTYDLLHVAAARLLGCDTFWSFDERAAKLAKLAGLKIHPRPPA
jgi:predicted nucleic acid-binding protein